MKIYQCSRFPFFFSLIAFFLVLVLIPIPFLKAKTYTNTEVPQGARQFSVGATSTSPRVLILSREVCQHLLIDAEPARNLTYVPGIDAAGASVASPDLDGRTTMNAFKVPNNITTPLEINLSGPLNAKAEMVETPEGEALEEETPESETPESAVEKKNSENDTKPMTFIGKSTIGTIAIHLDGQAYFNGRALGNTEQAALKKACRQYSQ